jgi:hypothetical protein
MQFMNMLGHLFRNVCIKLECYKVVVENFCNNKKFASKLVSVSVSKVSRDLEIIERECLLINFTTRDM